MKIIKANILKLIDNTETTFSSLFEDLVLLKNFKSKKFDFKSIYNFQYKLGLELYKLATVRNEITAQEKKLIDKKSKVELKWFVSKMKLYKAFKDAIDNCIVIGKTLGDAF